MAIDSNRSSRPSTPGVDHATHYRRRARVGDALGVALWLTSAFAVALFLLSGGTARFGTVPDAVTSVGITTGLVGTNLVLAMLLLAAVIVSSAALVRRRFSYEAWHLMHLLSYVAVLASVPHQLSIGSVLSPLSFERVYWLALYVMAFGAILTHRLAEPLVSSLRHRLRVQRMEPEAPGVVSIYLAGRRLRALESVGGQFFVWRFWTAGTWWHSHPISLSSVVTDAELRITVRDLGGGSRSISSVPVGRRVWFEGPYGIFTDAGRTAPKLAIVVAGIGITPVRAMLEHSVLEPGEATILLRASRLDDTFLWGEIEQLAREKGVAVTTMIGPRARSGPGWMTQDDADP